MNEALRSHVTRVGFDLTLTGRQMETLVIISEFWAKNRKHFGGSHFVPSVHGLMRRGLVWHQMPPKPSDKVPANKIYGVTSAGKLVVGLLKEAGLFDEILAQLEGGARSVA